MPPADQAATFSMLIRYDMATFSKNTTAHSRKRFGGVMTPPCRSVYNYEILFKFS